MSDRFPTLAEAINTAVELGLRSLSTMIPAKVVKWDADKQKADCQILIKQVTEGEDGEREAASWPVVPDVPVQFYGAGEYRITCPVGVGTIGALEFAHRSLDKWLTGSGGEVDPELDHDHGLQDAVFRPGLKPFGAPWQDVPVSGMSIGKDGGIQITITDDVITAGTTTGNTPQFVALSDLVAARLNYMQGIIDAHIHTVAAAPGNTSVPTVAIGSLASTACTKLKAE